MNEELQALTEYMHEIAGRSLDGEITWDQPTPSTFQWVKEGQGSKRVVTVQRAISASNALRVLSNKAMLGDASSYDYLFQVQELSPKRVLVSLSSKERPELAKIIAEVYAGAERGVDSRTNRVLQSLLRD